MNEACETSSEAAVPKELLIIDDDRVVSTALRKSLEKKGFSVRVARYAEDALDLVKDRPVDYMLVDLRLPDESGLNLISRLVESCPEARIVMLTGYGSIASAVEAIKLGAHHYLTKPVTVDEVLAAFARDEPQPDAPIADRPLSVDRMEWEHINRVLTAHNGNISATARELGMHRRSLQRKLAKHPVRD